MASNSTSTSLADVVTCPAKAYQKARVCVPVNIQPFAKPGSTIITRCGDPIITEGAVECEGTINGQCFFTISQEICVEVPVEFGATFTVGDASVLCNGTSAQNICRNCSAS